MLLIAKAALGVSATLALASVYVFHEGVIRVDVDESRSGGSHVHFWVPATTVSMGLRLAPRHHLEHAASQARPYLPVLREIAKELQKFPNAEFVDVRDGSQHVHIAVRDGRLYVDEVSDSEQVHVSVPIVVLADVADRLEDAAPTI
ncbi:MAG TPA: hypothetical protein VEI54_02820 [Candidatus Limnocylindrales bacterium]|nr:hypothetical protein [Candidatus Limnocylindrales bacterium]